MSTRKCLLESVHPLDLISQVKKWPVLFEKNRPERANHNFRMKIWQQVAKSLLDDWDAFTAGQRQNAVSDIIKKWRNLRDTFKRQLHIDKKIKKGHNIKKKVYVYYEHMKFLKEHLTGDEDETVGAEPVDPSYHLPQQPHMAPRRTRNSLRRKESPNQPSSSVFIEDIDEDKHFLMSLIPSFKKMTDEEKLTVKMEILKTIRAVRRCGSEDPTDALGGSSPTVPGSGLLASIDHIKQEMPFEHVSQPQRSDSDQN